MIFILESEISRFKKRTGGRDCCGGGGVCLCVCDGGIVVSLSCCASTVSHQQHLLHASCVADILPRGTQHNEVNVENNYPRSRPERCMYLYIYLYMRSGAEITVKMIRQFVSTAVRDANVAFRGNCPISVASVC